ncbi:hypothetical protein H696_05634 [Fonticula alba]|uniref:Uncharacterized protein n=1 Tax=Fonticula alba TaxID=691883 RepID=A0A058Z0X3_FONAL|nr:hypothetical protein H696_05634 [Fonticula alba]KCV67905.1 hypothetical protein H696_05634 [Fonticula alba]|eukprot:XP_009497725.1 hypothetical protein H696_05634 [Fonticula alba]
MSTAVSSASSSTISFGDNAAAASDAAAAALAAAKGSSRLATTIEVTFVQSLTTTADNLRATGASCTATIASFSSTSTYRHDPNQFRWSRYPVYHDFLRNAAQVAGFLSGRCGDLLAVFRRLSPAAGATDEPATSAPKRPLFLPVHVLHSLEKHAKEMSFLTSHAQTFSHTACAHISELGIFDDVGVGLLLARWHTLAQAATQALVLIEHFAWLLDARLPDLTTKQLPGLASPAGPYTAPDFSPDELALMSPGLKSPAIQAFVSWSRERRQTTLRELERQKELLQQFMQQTARDEALEAPVDEEDDHNDKELDPLGSLSPGWAVDGSAPAGPGADLDSDSDAGSILLQEVDSDSDADADADAGAGADSSPQPGPRPAGRQPAPIPTPGSPQPGALPSTDRLAATLAASEVPHVEHMTYLHYLSQPDVAAFWQRNFGCRTFEVHCVDFVEALSREWFFRLLLADTRTNILDAVRQRLAADYCSTPRRVSIFRFERLTAEHGLFPGLLLLLRAPDAAPMPELALLQLMPGHLRAGRLERLTGAFIRLLGKLESISATSLTTPITEAEKQAIADTLGSDPFPTISTVLSVHPEPAPLAPFSQVAVPASSPSISTIINRSQQSGSGAGGSAMGPGGGSAPGPGGTFPPGPGGGGDAAAGGSASSGELAEVLDFSDLSPHLTRQSLQIDEAALDPAAIRQVPVEDLPHFLHHFQQRLALIDCVEARLDSFHLQLRRLVQQVLPGPDAGTPVRNSLMRMFSIAKLPVYLAHIRLHARYNMALLRSNILATHARLEAEKAGLPAPVPLDLFADTDTLSTARASDGLASGMGPDPGHGQPDPATGHMSADRMDQVLLSLRDHMLAATTPMRELARLAPAAGGGAPSGAGPTLAELQSLRLRRHPGVADARGAGSLFRSDGPLSASLAPINFEYSSAGLRTHEHQAIRRLVRFMEDNPAPGLGDPIKVAERFDHLPRGDVHFYTRASLVSMPRALPMVSQVFLFSAGIGFHRSVFPAAAKRILIPYAEIATVARVNVIPTRLHALDVTLQNGQRYSFANLENRDDIYTLIFCRIRRINQLNHRDFMLYSSGLLDCVEVFEHQRYSTLNGYSAAHLLETDPAEFTDVLGQPVIIGQIRSAGGAWHWITPWQVDDAFESQADGWMYATDFSASASWGEESLNTMVRRRRHFRKILRLPTAKSGAIIREPTSHRDIQLFNDVGKPIGYFQNVK